MKKSSLSRRILGRLGRLGKVVIPFALRKIVEERVFYAVFHVTRVTNDAYGWRPSEKQEHERDEPR